MKKIINVADLINSESGKTYRQENTEKTHNIPIGNLVEVKYDKWYGDGACEKVHARLWVVSHDRDCDGTPLYSVSRWFDPDFAKQVRQMVSGLTEEMLEVVELTNDLVKGKGALAWPYHD